MKLSNDKKTSLIYFAIALLFTLGSTSCGTSSHEGHEDDSHGHDSTAMHEDHESAKEHNCAHWTYKGESGPEKWAELCPDYSGCSGTKQSPIDLNGDQFNEELEELILSYSSGTELNATNNGHTVQVNIANGSTFMLDTIPFELKQFHFHCPSEHTLSGKVFPMEVHLVHLSEAGAIAVVGILFEEGEENAFLSTIINELPVSADSTVTSTTNVDVNSLLPKTKNYYKYTGSLTTPPCTEGVNWFVMKTPISASKEQIEKFISMMPAHNARPVQPLNERTIGSN